MATSTIRIINGNDNYRSGSLSVSAQVLTTNEFPPQVDGKRSHYPNDMHRLGLYGVTRVGQQMRLPGSTVGNQDLGVWWDASYVVPDGMVFMIMAQTRMRQTGAQSRTSRVLLRTRAAAPLWRLSPQRIVDPLANQNVIPVIEGRWDFITMSQAAGLGCAVVSTDPAVRRSYSMEAWRGLIDYAKLAEGTPAPRFATESIEVDGETKQVATMERRRKLNID